MPEAMFHILVIAVAAVVMAIFIFLIFRWESLRSKHVLAQATDQMHKTGILLRLTSTNDPTEIKKVQQRLAQLGVYHGDPDGVLDQETIDALHTIAQRQSIDVDTEIGKLFHIEEPKSTSNQRAAVKSAYVRLTSAPR